MNWQTASMTIPFSMTDDGVIRVGHTRVTLDTVVEAFGDGATAEEIVQQYPSLKLSDVYHALGYYLDHQAEVRDYLQQRQRAAGIVREQNELRFDPSGVRTRLLARRS